MKPITFDSYRDSVYDLCGLLQKLAVAHCAKEDTHSIWRLHCIMRRLEVTIREVEQIERDAP